MHDADGSDLRRVPMIEVVPLKVEGATEGCSVYFKRHLVRCADEPSALAHTSVQHCHPRLPNPNRNPSHLTLLWITLAWMRLSTGTIHEQRPSLININS